jgi:hypothetical protein
MQEQELTFREGETVEVKGIPEASGPIQPTVPNSLKVSVNTKDTEAFKKALHDSGKIRIKTFIDPKSENMGLEKYNYVVFPGAYHEEQLAAIERNGVVRYINGLDEFAPEVQNILDKDEKEAVIYNIRCIISYLEKALATNVIDPLDPEFWNKVKLLRPDNHTFWGKVSIRCSNEPTILDPANDPYDLIKYIAIEAGGFDLVCKSFEDAMSQPVAPKFYLDKESQTVSVKTSFKRLRNQAISVLDDLSSKKSPKLMYIAKVLDTNSVSYKKSTPEDVLYDALDQYINGEGIERDKKKAAQTFIDTSKLDMETLKLKAIVKDATFYKIISLKGDGMLYHTASQTMLSRNVSGVVEYLKNPINEDMLVKIMNEVENYWGK